ncbi:MAG: DNA replication/repair protein RecF, partial [Acidimicrobiia bacterium]
VAFEYRSGWGGRLDPSVAAADWAADFLRALADGRRSDLERGLTGVGPHRDEPWFLLGGADLRTHASQGEQRTFALSLRLASHRVIAQQVGGVPLLLLDDVFSELDAARSERLATVFPEAQTFVTTTRPEEVPMSGKRWSVGESGVW